MNIKKKPYLCLFFDIRYGFLLLCTCSQDFFRIFDPFFRWRIDSFQRIINMQIFPFKGSECPLSQLSSVLQ